MPRVPLRCRLARLAAVGACLVLLAGCTGKATEKPKDAPKVNKENFDKVKEGMTEKEVEDVLGAAEGAISSEDLEKMMKGVAKGLPVEMPGVAKVKVKTAKGL